MGKDLAILRDRRFSLLFAARTAAVLGSAFGPVALAFGVLALPGANATTLSVVTATQGLCMVAFMLIGGVIADRLPRFRVMVAADLSAAMAWGGLAAMLITGWAPLWALLLLAGMAGTATALFFPAFTGAVPEVVAVANLQSANGILRLGMNGARVAGFAVAGGTVALVGAGWAMVVNVGLLVTSAALIASVRPVQREIAAMPTTAALVSPAGAGAASMVRDLRDGWQEFRSRQWLWVVVVQFSFVMMVFQAVLGVLGPVIANERLGGAQGWSWVLAAESVGMLVGVVFAIRARPKRPIRLVVLLSFPLASLPLALGLGAPVLVAAAAALIVGIAIDIIVVMWDTTMQREIPRESLSRVSSYDALGTFLLGPLGVLLAGPSVDAIGVTNALLISAAVTVVASAAALCAPGVRSLRWGPSLSTAAAARTRAVDLDRNGPAVPPLAAPAPAGTLSAVDA